MRVLLAVLSLALAWEAAAEVSVEEIPASLCSAAPPELLPWLWISHGGDLDGDGRGDLIVPSERDLGELPSRMRVLLGTHADMRYRDIGRVPYADAMVVEDYAGVRVISLLEELHPRAIRAHQFEIRRGRLVHLGRKTIGVRLYSIAATFEQRGTIICDPGGPLHGRWIPEIRPPEGPERRRRTRERVVELLRPTHPASRP